MERTVNQRIKSLLKQKKISISSLAKEFGMPQTSLSDQINKEKMLKVSTISAIISKFNDISEEWLLTGKGAMLKNNQTNENINGNTGIVGNNETTASEHVCADRQNEGDFVSLYDVSAAAGYGTFDEMITAEKIIGKYYIPDFKNIDWMIYVKGSSMYPKYSSGDIIACRVLKESRFIQWGKVYVVATREQGLLVKRLKESENKDCLKAVPDNPDYDAFDIPKDEILGIALVIGVISLE
jgi:phage repressor protein C with HTH and peptisase S24 domain